MEHVLIETTAKGQVCRVQVAADRPSLLDKVPSPLLRSMIDKAPNAAGLHVLGNVEDRVLTLCLVDAEDDA